VSLASLDESLRRIRKLIEADDLESALDQLGSLVDPKCGDLADTTLLITSQNNRLRREWEKRLLTREQYLVDRSGIASRLLTLLASIPSRIEPRKAPLGIESTPALESAPAPERVAFEKILGINNLKQISWIGRGMVAARSVCRLLTPTGVGTGFLVAPGLLMTNHHVVPDAVTATATVAEFNYQEDGNGKLLATVRYGLDPSMFRTSPRDLLDYTLVGLRPDPTKPASDGWGFLPLNPNADPVRTEHVVIIQHPNGGPKQIALTANWVVAAQGPRLLYTTDTQSGSSGSPVFNDSWQVIAIHHAGAREYTDAAGKILYLNEGILMSAIKPDAGVLWPIT
jgi:V8-like Glu-specific endopeptidase